MKLVVEKVVNETNDAVSISLKNNRLFNKIKYKPGQFLTVKIPIDGVVHKRAYSFSSNPYLDKNLKFTVKRVEKGLISNYLVDSIKQGDKLEIEKPSGSFYVDVDSNNSKQYVLFAGGSGITPIYSIVKSILVKEPSSKILLIYANQNARSIIFHKELKELEREFPTALSVHFILSINTVLEPENYYTGLLTKELLDGIFRKKGLAYNNHVYMICGPFGYMEKVKEILGANGISRDKIKVEVFKSPAVKSSGKDLMSDVTINFNGEAHKIKVKGDKSILQQAMSDNIALPYSCRSGMCSSCKATCVAGEVTMIEGHFLDETDVANGKILTCISYPASEEVVIEI